MTRRKAVALTRPELPERPYDFSSPAPTGEDGAARPARGEKESGTGEECGPHTTPPLKGVCGGLPSHGPKKHKDRTRTSNPTTERHEALLAELLALPAAVRRDILARASLSEKEARTGKGRELEMWSGAVYSALVDAIGAGGEVGAGPASVRRLLADSSSWGPVANFLRHAGFLELAVPKLQSVLNMIAGLLVEYALGVSRKTGTPLTPKFVASCAVHVSSVFESSFPGYAKKPALVAILARRLTEPKETTG